MLLAEPIFLFFFNFAAGAALGNVLYRSDFCMAGMFRDIFLFKNYSLLRFLLLLVSVSAALYYGARLFGLIALYPPPGLAYPSAATLIGGLVFGIGMVLAGGCVVGTLYKMAGGNLSNFIAFIGIIAGSALYAEVHPWWESFRSQTVFFRFRMLSEISPAVETVLISATSALSAGLFMKWKRGGRWTLTAYADGYFQPWKAAIAIALLNTAVYIFSGWPMGITTAYAKIGAYLESFFAPLHAAKLAYFTQDHLSIVLGDMVLSGGAGPRTDIVSFTETALLLGVFAGAFFTAVALKEFKIYGLPPARQIAGALIGGILVGLGARIAAGCNLKFVLGALPLFAFQGIAFVAAMIAGAAIGAGLFRRYIVS